MLRGITSHGTASKKIFAERRCRTASASFLTNRWEAAFAERPLTFFAKKEN